MTRDEIIEIAQQVTKEFDYLWCNNMPELERFADLVEQRANAWRPASEPPEDGRDVVVWMNDGGHGCFAIGHCLRGEWSPNYVGSPVTHWRDVEPPTTEGE